ncbi:MAG: NAD(P)-dependent oxidoreductase [Phycisphaerae bacterium]|nr:NAD(P)-dependent oxidoreductase [Phycisphaerae bacterium]
MEKKVLITAADGFLGAHCLPVLAINGYEIHAIGQKIPPTKTKGVCWYNIDLMQPAKITQLITEIRPTHLIHLAWSGSPNKIGDAPVNIRWMLSSLHLLQEFADHNGTNAMILGCYSEYDLAHGICHEESTARRPTSLYGACKHSLKLICEAYAQQVGMRLVWGRLFGYYGPGNDSDMLIPSVIRTLLGNQKFICSHGAFLRDYLYIDDVAAAMVAVMESDYAGPINIASGKGIRIEELVTILGELTGHPELLEIRNDPGALHDSPAIIADTKKLNNVIGWTPKVSLEQGLKTTVEWWKSKSSSSELVEH